LVKCVKSIMDVALGVASAFGTPPDPSAIITAAAKVPQECLCMATWINPFAICALLRDVLDLVIAMLKCIRGILSKLVTLNLRASGMMLDPLVSVQRTGQCLFGLIRVQQETALISLDWLGVFLNAISFLFSVAGLNPPSSISINLTDLGAGAPLAPVVSIIDMTINALAIPREAASVCAKLGGY
jgi:hypothetical protein